MCFQYNVKSFRLLLIYWHVLYVCNQLFDHNSAFDTSWILNICFEQDKPDRIAHHRQMQKNAIF